MLIFKYTVKWRIRGWFFRRLHGVVSAHLDRGVWTFTKANGVVAKVGDAYGAEFLFGRGVKVTEEPRQEIAPPCA